MRKPELDDSDHYMLFKDAILVAFARSQKRIPTGKELEDIRVIAIELVFHAPTAKVKKVFLDDTGVVVETTLGTISGEAGQELSFPA